MLSNKSPNGWLGEIQVGVGVAAMGQTSFSSFALCRYVLNHFIS